MIVGLLALQGDVPEHMAAFRAADPGVEVRLISRPEDLEGVGALVIPGGESTTVADLLERTRLWYPVRERLRAGLPVLGTCAGLILLATEIEPSDAGRNPPTLGLIDVRVRRNDYGRQVESFEAPVRVSDLPGGEFPGVFIRAPRIVEIHAGVTPFVWRADEVVGVRAGRAFGLTFHPELAGDPRLFRAFLTQARQRTPKSKSRNKTSKTDPTAAASP